MCEKKSQKKDEEICKIGESGKQQMAGNLRCLLEMNSWNMKQASSYQL